MGCNCSKNTQPTGFMGTAQQDANRTAAAAAAVQAAADKSTSTEGSTQAFVLTDRNGRTQSFSRKLDAEAARIRSGGGTVKSA